MGELDDFINSLHIPIFGYTDFRMLEAFAGYYEQRPEGFANPFEQINPAGRLRPLPEEPELTTSFPWASLMPSPRMSSTQPSPFIPEGGITTRSSAHTS